MITAPPENSTIFIREAISKDAPLLTALRRGSISKWGYSNELIQTLMGEIIIPEELLYTNEHIFALVKADLPLGFYRFVYHQSKHVSELVDFYVDLPHMNKGFGKRLWQDAVKRSLALGASWLDIVSDPHAERFYLDWGAVRVGNKLSPADPNITLLTLRYKL